MNLNWSARGNSECHPNIKSKGLNDSNYTCRYVLHQSLTKLEKVFMVSWGSQAGQMNWHSCFMIKMSWAYFCVEPVKRTFSGCCNYKAAVYLKFSANYLSLVELVQALLH